MPRGCWSVLAAVAGLILSGAGEPPGGRTQGKTAEAQEDEKQRLPTIADPRPIAVEVIERPKKPEPCGPNWYGSKDDLCAQWKAADSAAEAATWANWQLWLSGAGIVGLLFSLYYTRKAVLVAEDATKDAITALKIAETNAQAAVDLAKISERSAKLQLRAYLSIASISVEEPDWIEIEIDGQGIQRILSSKATLNFANNGETPAQITYVYNSFSWHVGEIIRGMLTIEKEIKFFVHKGVQTYLPYPIRADIDGLEEVGKLYAMGVVSYVDVFGDPHSETFCFIADQKSNFFNINFPVGLDAFSADEYLKILEAVEDGENTDGDRDEGA